MELDDQEVIRRGLEDTLEVQRRWNELNKIISEQVDRAALIPERDREQFATNDVVELGE